MLKPSSRKEGEKREKERNRHRRGRERTRERGRWEKQRGGERREEQLLYRPPPFHQEGRGKGKGQERGKGGKTSNTPAPAPAQERQRAWSKKKVSNPPPTRVPCASRDGLTDWPLAVGKESAPSDKVLAQWEFTVS